MVDFGPKLLIILTEFAYRKHNVLRNMLQSSFKSILFLLHDLLSPYPDISCTCIHSLPQNLC